MVISSQIIALVSSAQSCLILIFGYFIPALSSVKAVVQRDPEAYHQWATYWLILHLYQAVLSPIFHLTLHPLFQLLSILWLSLPRYQGATFVYERIVNPWVDKYEEQVDGAVEEAHRGVRKWVLGRVWRLGLALMGEGGSMVGSLVDGVLGNVVGDMLGNDIRRFFKESQSDNSVSGEETKEKTTNVNPPQHSVRQALSQSSSLGESFYNEEIVENEGFSSLEERDAFLRDFLTMLQQGLYVFASVEKKNNPASEHFEEDDEDDITENSRKNTTGGFKLGVFSYKGPCSRVTVNDGEERIFLISPVGGNQSEENDADKKSTTNTAVSSMPLRDLEPAVSSGSQGILLTCRSNGIDTEMEIVLSDESDRDILLNGLKLCLAAIKSDDVDDGGEDDDIGDENVQFV